MGEHQLQLGRHDADGTPAVTPGGSRKRVRRIIWLVILIILLAPIGRYCYLRITRRPTPRRDYWVARLIEDRRNSSFKPTKRWIDAVEVMNALAWPPYQVRMPVDDPYLSIPEVLKGEWDANRRDTAFVNEHLQSTEFQESRDMLAAALVDGWQEDIALPLSSSNTPVSQYSSWCNWLLADARRALAVENNWHRAQVNWLTCLRLARQAHMYRCTYPTIRGLSIQERTATEILFAATERCVNFTTGEFTALVDEIVGPLENPSRLFNGQRLQNLAMLDTYFVADGGWIDVSEAVARTQPGSQPSRLWNVTSFLFNDVEQSRSKVNLYFQLMDQITTLADAWATGTSRRVWFHNFALDVPDGRIYSDYYDWPAWTLDDYYMTRMQVDASLTMLAISSFYESEGRLPDRLEELVPQYLARLPIDYIDMQPMRYRHDEDAYHLYSLGPDLDDDSGTPLESLRGTSRQTQGDIVFSSWTRPENRKRESP